MSYDVAFYRATSSGPVEQVLADALDSGRIVSGPEKLAQRFLLELMTKKNETPGLTGGSDFLNRLQNMNARTETDVFTALASSINEVVSTLQAAELETDADNERLVSVRIDRLELDVGTLNLRLRLKTRAATLVPVEIPLDFLLL